MLQVKTSARIFGSALAGLALLAFAAGCQKEDTLAPTQDQAVTADPATNQTPAQTPADPTAAYVVLPGMSAIPACGTYAPVCGKNWITYMNACQAKKAGVAVMFNGACRRLGRPAAGMVK